MSFTKTGTTICAMTWKVKNFDKIINFQDGVIVAADTRSTGGTVVANKNCEKVHYLAPNIYCCGAGTAADCNFTTLFLQSDLELQRLNTGR